jgi:hypothetical protein
MLLYTLLSLSLAAVSSLFFLLYFTNILLRHLNASDSVEMLLIRAVYFACFYRCAIAFLSTQPRWSISSPRFYSNGVVLSQPSADATLIAEEVPYIVNYTLRTIAVCGSTKPLRDALFELGGKYNPRLKKDGRNERPGWVFPLIKAEIVREVVEKYKSDPASFIKPNLFEEQKHADDDVKPFIENYSGKSIAVFGNTRKVKELFKRLGGKFNRYLKHNGGTRVGWVFPKSRREEVLAAIEGRRMGGGADMLVALTDDENRDDEEIL